MAGNRFYNNSTAYLLNRMDLGELVTRTPQEYIDLAVRMIDNPDYRNRMIRRLKTADLDKTLLSLEHVPAFVRAIDHLLENHDSLKKDAKRTPITIH
jgi:predicted O-linked N-acetylglucosamine transferase (SPINDLY family)